MSIGLLNTMRREAVRMSHRPIYIVMMLVVPVLCALFFISLLSPALPLKTPAAVVDLDHSQLSRQVTRTLNSTELVSIRHKVESYDKAMAMVRQGSIFGFFVIPADFEKDAMAGKSPTLVYYSNMTYFVPGTLSFKGFKTVSVVTSGGIATAKLTALGLPSGQISPLVQPVSISAHGIGNPWTNYSYYLTPSFSFATLALMIMIMTVFSITVEIKQGSSVDWLQTAHGSIGVALLGKMLPHSLLYLCAAYAMEALMFGYNHFPMNGSLGWFLLATALFVLATQALGAFIACVLPNPRLAMSVVSLVGVLTFSFAGFSFPVEQMYGAIGIFSYIVPVRYFFLTYVNTALNGFDIYYARHCLSAMTAFLYLPWLMAWRLKKACLRPVYVP